MSASSEIIWWHFSDLHWEVGRFAAKSQFLTELFKDLRNRLTLHGTPDFIVFSGDISSSGEYAQFEDAKKHFFDPLLEICAPQQIPIFVVAGNHDLSRKQARLLNPEMITSIKSVQALNEFLDDEDSRRSVMTPLGGFKQFSQLLNSEIKDEEDVLAWSREFSVRGQPIYIAGVNTSWASSYNRDLGGKISDERNLLLGQWQFNHLQPQSNEVMLSLLIMHHPSTSLLGVVEHQANSYMQQHFDFVLFGHTHTVRDLSQRLSPAGECIYLPSPAVYTSEFVDSLEFARGYNIVTYNPKEKNGKAYYYRYSEIMGAQFKPFIDLYPNGQSYYPLELQTPNPPLPHYEIYRSYEDVINSSPNAEYSHKHHQKNESEKLYSRQELLKVFVSYSHRDRKYLERLLVHLKNLERNGMIDIWSDAKIVPGANWRDEIRLAIDSAKVAILLISADFLASPFIAENELPPLLKGAETKGTTILPIILSPCDIESSNLSQFQALNSPSGPLTKMKQHHKEEIWTKVAAIIRGAVTAQSPSDFD